MKKIDIVTFQKISIKNLYKLFMFFKKNNINAFIFYGTLLGAVRDHGFIPWDDDLDIILDYKSYLYLKELSLKLPEPLIFQDFGRELPYGICRINFSNILKAPFGTKMYQNVDIFVTGGIASNNKQLNRLSQKSKNVIKYSQIKHSHYWSKNLIKRIGKFILFPLLPGEKKRDTVIKNNFSKINKGTEKTILITDLYQFPYIDYSNFTLLNLGNYLFPAPTNYIQLLEKLYGDYSVPVIYEDARKKDYYLVE